MAWDPHAATCARKMASLISRDEDPYFCKIQNRCSAHYSNVRCNIWHLWYMHDACLDLWKLELFVFCLLWNCFFLCDENLKVYPWICTLPVQMVQLSLWLSSWKELRSSRICSWSRFSTCSELHRNWWRPSGPEMKQEEDWYHGHSLICYIASFICGHSLLPFRAFCPILAQRTGLAKCREGTLPFAAPAFAPHCTCYVSANRNSLCMNRELYHTQ